MSKYIYGPVPSRRLGRSLGVDLVPMKTCSFNCIYCQLRPTQRTTIERAEYAPVPEMAAEVKARLAEGPPPDYVTLSGSGEPTLHASFGRLAADVRAFTDVPIALLTNGSLFHLPEVRAACPPIDLILPSLDAGDEATFQRINRPHAALMLEQLVGGLESLRREFAGQIWLEVFVVEGANSSDEQVRRIAECAERIAPDRIQINTAVRPPAEPNIGPAPSERLEQICRALGPRAEIIVPRPASEASHDATAKEEQVLALLRRRPCTLDDIAAGLGMHPNEVIKHVRRLLDENAIERRQRLYESYYEATEDP